MATIEQLIQENLSPPMADMVKVFRDHPEYIPIVFEPLLKAGFRDFKWVGSGSNAFFVAPTDNDNIVFRVSDEGDARRNDIPFFLCGGYESFCNLPKQDAVCLEMLLAGKKDIPENDKRFLFDEMKQVGWRPDSIECKDAFWNDVVMISLRDGTGRVKNVPIISDPSALLQHLWGAGVPSQNFNRCSGNYITLQDQAAAYNAIIESDSRLKTLIAEPVKFPETGILPVQTPSVGKVVK